MPIQHVLKFDETFNGYGVCVKEAKKRKRERIKDFTNL